MVGAAREANFGRCFGSSDLDSSRTVARSHRRAQSPRPRPMGPTAGLEDIQRSVPDFITPITNAMRTSSDKLAASIFVMTLARYISTVRGLIARSKAMILFGLPATKI